MYLFLLVFLDSCCEFRVDHDTATIFAHNHFLVHLDFDLLLRGNAVEAATAGVTVDDDDAETIAGILADTLECIESTVVDTGFERLGTTDEIFLFGAGFVDDIVEVGFLLGQNLSLVYDILLDRSDVGLAVVDFALDFANVLLAEFDFESLVFDFLGKIVEFVVVAHIVELLTIALDERLLVLDLVLLGSTLDLEILDIALIALYAGVKTGDSVLQVLHLERELAADVADAVDFGENGLEFVEGL